MYSTEIRRVSGVRLEMVRNKCTIFSFERVKVFRDSIKNTSACLSYVLFATNETSNTINEIT